MIHITTFPECSWILYSLLLLKYYIQTETEDEADQGDPEQVETGATAQNGAGGQQWEQERSRLFVHT